MAAVTPGSAIGGTSALRCRSRQAEPGHTAGALNRPTRGRRQWPKLAASAGGATGASHGDAADQVGQRRAGSPYRIVSLEGVSTSQLAHAADVYGQSMAHDPVLGGWATGGKCPDSVARFFSNLALMALNASPERSACWALQPPPSSSSPAAPAADLASAPPMAMCVAYEYPRACPSEWALLRAGLVRVLISAPSLRALSTFFRIAQAFDEGKERFFKAHGPFLYICCFGTSPEFQGKGLGGELMREVLAYAGKLGVPAYLECGSVDSCRFYARHGFQVLHELRVEPTAPPMFLMANRQCAGKAGNGHPAA